MSDRDIDAEILAGINEITKHTVDVKVRFKQT